MKAQKTAFVFENDGAGIFVSEDLRHGCLGADELDPLWDLDKAKRIEIVLSPTKTSGYDVRLDVTADGILTGKLLVESEDWLDDICFDWTRRLADAFGGRKTMWMDCYILEE